MLMTTNTNTKPKLYVDFDTTMVNSPKILTICYEKLTGIKPLTYNPLDWNIAMAYPNYDKDIIHTIFDISLFFEYAKDNIFEGCKETLEELSNYYDITVVSCGTDANLTLKEQFLKEEFSYVSFVGLSQTSKTFDKSSVCQNGILIDDRLDCLLSTQNCKNVLFRYNNNPYEWQEGYEQLLLENKIDFVTNSWKDKDFIKYLHSELEIEK